MPAPNYFSEDELRTLCFELRIDYEDIAGTTKESKARELLLYCSRNNTISALIKLIKTKRPNIPEHDLVGGDLHLLQPVSKIDNMFTVYCTDNPLCTKSEVIDTLSTLLPSHPWPIVNVDWLFQVDRPKDLSLIEFNEFNPDYFIAVTLIVQIEERFVEEKIDRPQGLLDIIAKDMPEQTQLVDVPITQTLELTEKISGTSRNANCGTCSGTGTIQTRCGSCDGTGRIGTSQGNSECRSCHGSGLLREMCRACGGTGYNPVCQYYGRKVKPMTFTLCSAKTVSGRMYSERINGMCDVLWRSSVQRKPFDKLPFDPSPLGQTVARAVTENYKKTIQGIAEEVHKGRWQLSHEAKVLNPTQTHAIPFHNSYLNLFQVVIEIAPVYRLNYARKSRRTFGVLWWQKEVEYTTKGEVWLLGSKEISICYHNEQFVSQTG